MTQEEKAKAYDKAYKVAESIHRFSSNPAEIERMEEIFPQLRESKDEKIRKELLDYLYDVHDDDEERASWIAWLKKQVNHTNFCNNIQIGDKVTRNEDGVLVNLSQLKRVAKKDEKQIKKKNLQDNSFRRTFEQNLAWSEEDMEMIGTLIAIFEVNYPDGFYKVNPIGTTNMQGIHSSEIIKWFKSLKDRIHPQPKQEWSEEDERIKQDIENLIHFALKDGSAVSPAADTTKEGALDWLKSLRPQPRQEWSEEDENRFRNLIYLVEHSDEGKATKEGFIKFINRLKSLK